MAPKKMPLAKKLLLIAVPLVLLQIFYLFVFSKSAPPMNVKDAINQQIAQHKNLDSDRKELVKVQMALSSYRLDNKEYPKNLAALVPQYIDAVPLDPATGSPFKYSTADDRYTLGTPSNEGQSKTKKGTTKGKGKNSAQDADTLLIAYLDEGEKGNEFVYDPSTKRDPFRSFDFTPKAIVASGDTPLEQYAYSDLKVAAVLEGFGEPKAVVEDSSGKGHTVTVGTKIGNLGGTVMKIETNKITILEESVDFTGETQSRTVEMFIR